MNKEGYLDKIATKLINNIQLEPLEISTIVSALRKYTDNPQEPYYEVIYHDEYDNTEHRIMNPVSSKEYKDISGCKMRDDFFELRFRRIVREEGKYNG